VPRHFVSWDESRYEHLLGRACSGSRAAPASAANIAECTRPSSGATFHVEHTLPASAGGSDELINLAWACPSCNLKKSNRLTAKEPETGTCLCSITDRSEDHFVWQRHVVVGRTPAGRALVAALDLNHARRLLIREAEEAFDLFPP
jgi:hypothetical protein